MPCLLVLGSGVLRSAPPCTGSPVSSTLKMRLLSPHFLQVAAEAAREAGRAFAAFEALSLPHPEEFATSEEVRGLPSLPTACHACHAWFTLVPTVCLNACHACHPLSRSPQTQPMLVRVKTLACGLDPEALPLQDHDTMCLASLCHAGGNRGDR